MDKRTVGLQIVDTQGNVIEESNFKLTPGDILVVNTFEGCTMEQCSHMARAVGRVLEGKTDAMILPDGVKLEIIKKEIEEDA